MAARDVGRVILDMLEVIPTDDGAGNETALNMRAELRKLLGDLAYFAPELMGKAWARLAGIMQRYIPFPPETITVEWQKKVAYIFQP